MMNEKKIISTSKFMSRILRHQPELVGITLDENGWADTNTLITGMNEANLKVTLGDLKLVMANNNKQRFKFNYDFSKIRGFDKN